MFDKNNLIFDLNGGYFKKKVDGAIKFNANTLFFYMNTDAGYAVELVIIPAFFWRFDFLQYTRDLFASGTKMQCLQITLPTFGIPYSEICVPEGKNHHLRCNFSLGIKWTCLKYSIFTLSVKVKQGYRYNVFAGLFPSGYRGYFSVIEKQDY